MMIIRIIAGFVSRFSDCEGGIHTTFKVNVVVMC